jgi:hypothetical protein
MKDTAFEARFTDGPADAPVIYLNIEGLQNPSDVEAYFGGIDPLNDEVALSVIGPTEVSVRNDNADPILLRGTTVSVRTTMLEAIDFERRARWNEEWGKSMSDQCSKLNSRIDEAKHLLQDQRRRLGQKADRQAQESTVRLLYEQQISFIDRVLSKLDT